MLTARGRIALISIPFINWNTRTYETLKTIADDDNELLQSI